MKTIGLLSDTHGYIHPKMKDFFQEVDEIWHAGDLGSIDVYQKLSQFKPTIAVYGNIDGVELREKLKETEIYTCEKVKVVMTHIGGYPKRYHSGIKKLLQKEKPQLFISGHSHILKVMNDEDLHLLHMNPGAAGIQGFHHRITMLRFKISGDIVSDLEVFDAPRSH